MKEGTTRVTGQAAQKGNIDAARAVAKVVRSTLGPFGRDKMLVSSHGNVMVTNDGAEILKHMEITHPVAKIIADVASVQDSEVGDGTTSAVVLAGSLLDVSARLLEGNVHANTLIKGYIKAFQMADSILDKIAIDVDPYDDVVLKKIALTALGSKGVATGKEKLAEIAVQAIKEVAEEKDGIRKADLKRIRIVKAPGESLAETELVKGIVLEGEVDAPNMPKRIENAKIAILKHAIDLDRGYQNFTKRFKIDSPEAVKGFVSGEKLLMTNMVEKVAEAGANVLLCEKAIDMFAVNFLVRKQILTVRRIEGKEMEQIALATGGQVVMDAINMRPEDLGEAALVEERKIGKTAFIFILGCKSPKSVTIVLRGGERHVINEAERALHDALCAVRNTLEDGKIVAGGGSTEEEMANKLRKYALEFRGREQLAIKSFAYALESIPTALAENAGLDFLTLVPNLRNYHEKEGGELFGLDVFTGNIRDMAKLDVLEPLRVKKQMLKSSTDAVSMVLRIDDIIAKKPAVYKEEGLEDRLKQREQIRRNRKNWVQTPVTIVK
jgi:thermosome